jgi:hypothetical protein
MSRRITDQHLDRLVAMALEAETLDGVNPPEAVPTGRRHAGRARVPGAARRLLPGVLACAAMVALAGVVGWQMFGVLSPAASTDRPRIARSSPSGPPATVLAQAPVPDDEQTVLLAIYHDPIVGTRCVQWRDFDFDKNRCLADVSPTELRGLCLKSAGLCACPADLTNVTLVALAGPRSALPATDSAALSLADCILASDRPCDSAGACYLPAARSCLPKGVSVKVENVGFGG